MSDSALELDPMDQFGVEIRNAIGSELRSIGIDNVRSFAERLGVIPGVARTIFAKSSWSVEEASWIVQRLNLPIRFDVVNNSLKS